MLRCLFAACLLLAPAAVHAQRRHVLIDTDAGPDDLMAIAFLLGRPDVRIDGITVVAGLTSPGTGARNVLRLLSLLHADSVRVYVGSAEHLQPTMPFPATWIAATEKRGADAAPPTARRPEAEGAVDFLARAITSRRADVQVLALGPLTNLALAIRKAGAARVRPLGTVIMGGALNAPGNLVTPDSRSENTKAEWNLFSDPLAAREVFASPLRIELISLDATRHVQMDSRFVRAIETGDPTPQRLYVGRIMEGAREWVERGDYYAWDPLAAVALVDPAAVTLRRVKLGIDLDPPFEGWTHPMANGSFVSVAISADSHRFLRVFDAALAAKQACVGCGRAADRRVAVPAGGF